MNVESVEDQPMTAAQPLPGADSRPGRRHGGWFWLVLLCILGSAAYGAYRGFPQVASRLSNGAKPAGPPPSRSAPVSAATARRGDLPIYLDALGTVIAFNTVTVRTRVDGELVEVAFTEGQTVHQGDLLAQIDPRPYKVQLDQAQGQLAKDGALLKNANLDLARYQTAGGAVAQQQLDTGAALVGQYEGAVKTDQAQVDAANLQLTYCRITAPLSGRIGLRLVDQGNMVHASDPNGLLVITQVQPIAVRFALWQDDLAQVLKATRAGQPPVAEAYDLDLKTRLAVGSLLAIDNQIDPGTGTARFKAVFENRDLMLFPNQFVNLRLLVDTRKGAVLIPAAAVQRSPQTTFVYVIKADETVEMRPVTPGPTTGGETLIERGVAAGERVVTDGVDKLQPGAKVTVPGAAESQPRGN